MSTKGSSGKSASQRRGRQAPTPAVSPAQRSPLQRLALASLALIALVLIAYSGSLGNGFVWDDHKQIVLNPTLRPDAPLARLFTSDTRFGVPATPTSDSTVHNADYRPLQMLSYRLLFAAFGPEPTAYHLCNLAFAIAGTLASLWLFWLLTGNFGIAFAAAALFAVHPVHTESVDWIASLPDLGFSLFLLLAFAFFLTARADGPRRWLPTTFSLLCFATALLWKESAVVFPVLLTVYVLLVPKTSGNPAILALRRTAPYWAILAGYLGLRIAVLGKLSSGPRDWALSPLQFTLTGLHLLWAYWAKLALPIGLNAYYLFQPIRSVTEPRAIAAILLTLAVVTLLLVLKRRATDAPLAIFAAVWVVVSLLPTLDLNALGRNAFAERYLYLPSVGYCLLLALIAARLIAAIPAPQRKFAAALPLALVLVAFTWETIVRNPVWKDDDTLFAETLRQSPDAPFVRVMVATDESANPSEAAAAERDYTKAIALARQQVPFDRVDAVVAYKGLAWIYADQSKLPQALNILSQAEKIAPFDPDEVGEKGLILARAGRGGEALPLLERSLAAEPNNENVLSALGLIAHQDLHDLNRAAEFFSRALAVHPEDDDFAASQHNNLGTIYGEQGKFAEAASAFRRASRIQPGDPEFHVNLATALAAQNRIDEARAEAEVAYKLDPTSPATHDILRRLSAE